MRSFLVSFFIMLGCVHTMSIASESEVDNSAPPMYKGTETLAYRVIEQLSDDIEIRQYPATVKVSALASGENNAFRQLFKYISGANTVKTQIAMTAPVEMSKQTSTAIAMTTPVEMQQQDGQQLMSFFLPAMYDAATAPKPTGPGVFLTPVPAKKMAVIRFSGLRGDSKVANKTEQLRSALNTTNYQIIAAPVIMGYDAPWTLWFNRRNEVMFEIQ